MAKSVRRVLKPDDPIFREGVQGFVPVPRPSNPDPTDPPQRKPAPPDDSTAATDGSAGLKRTP